MIGVGIVFAVLTAPLGQFLAIAVPAMGLLVLSPGGTSPVLMRFCFEVQKPSNGRNWPSSIRDRWAPRVARTTA